jgi:hypothetical protein
MLCALAQDYEPSGINFHLEESQPRKPKGRGSTPSSLTDHRLIRRAISDSAGYCSKRSMNHLSTRIQISSLPTWSSMPCSRLGLSLTSMTMKPRSVSLTSTP